MLLCGQCGASNQEGEDFCGECGAYLDWDAKKVTPERTPEPPARKEVPTQRTTSPGLVERVREAVGMATPITSAQPSEMARGGASQSRRDASRRDEPRTGESTSVVPPASSDPAASLVVRVPPQRSPDGEQGIPIEADGHPNTTSPESSPVAVQPGLAGPKARRRPTTPPKEPIDHGDLVCGQCGVGNKPSRKFCRRCGADLVDASVARVPWWRRLFRRQKAVPAAGTRPKPKKRRRGRVKSLVLLAVLAVLGVTAWMYRDAARPVYEYVRDWVDQEQYTPDVLTASSSAPGAGVRRAHDGDPNRYWAPATTGDARGEYLVARFDHPFRLTFLLIRGGVSDEQAPYLRHGRPERVRVVAVSADGARHVDIVRLEEESEPQDFYLPADDVVRVRLGIRSSREGSVQGSRVAIAEVEFFGRG